MLFSFIKNMTDAFYIYLMMMMMMMSVIFGKFKLNETHPLTHTYIYTYVHLFLGSLLQISHMIYVLYLPTVYAFTLSLGIVSAETT